MNSFFNTPLRGGSAIALIAVFALISGCGKSADPAPLTLDQAAGTVNEAFATAPDGTRQAAADLARKVAAGQHVESYFTLQSLSSNPDLTPEQRIALSQSQMSVMQKLTEAADQGDEDAQRTLQVHRARK